MPCLSGGTLGKNRVTGSDSLSLPRSAKSKMPALVKSIGVEPTPITVSTRMGICFSRLAMPYALAKTTFPSRATSTTPEKPRAASHCMRSPIEFHATAGGPSAGVWNAANPSARMPT